MPDRRIGFAPTAWLPAARQAQRDTSPQDQAEVGELCHQRTVTLLEAIEGGIDDKGTFHA